MTRPAAPGRGGALDPRLHGAFLQAAELLNSGRAAEAAARLAPLAAAAPGESEVRRALGEALRGTGDLPGAEREARAAVAADKRSAAAQHTLGSVLKVCGQPREAEKAWRAALALDRRFAPAAVELNRLLLAEGKPQLAAQATAALAAASRDAELLGDHAEALKAQGRKPEALEHFRRARDADPESAVGWHNFAAALADVRDDAHALAAVDRALALGLDRSEPWLVRAHALQGLNRYDEAERAYGEALRRRPGDVTAVIDFSQLLWMRTGDLAAALEPFAAADRAGAGSPTLSVGKARLLEFAGDAPAAMAVLEPAAAAGDRGALLALVNVAGRADPALASRHAEAAAARLGDDPRVRLMLAEARLGQGRAAEAAALVDTVLADTPLDQSALAVRAAAWRALDDPRLAQLYDYPRMVGAYTIDAPAGWPDLAAYLADLKAALARLHGLQAHPVGQSLRDGAQTSSELRRSEEPAVRAFFTAIDRPIREHIAKLGMGRDPLRARNTGRYAISGAWSVRLRPGGGRHVAHIHPEGWLSSAFYVEVPPAVDAGGREGWIGFGEPGAPVAGGPWPPQHWVKPEPGRLVLFPSYMWHGTAPFGGDAQRLTMAFDVVPA